MKKYKTAEEIISMYCDNNNGYYLKEVAIKAMIDYAAQFAPVDKEEMLAKDWFNKYESTFSYRLFKQLTMYADMYPNDTVMNITMQKFVKLRGSGARTWKELKERLNLFINTNYQ